MNRTKLRSYLNGLQKQYGDYTKNVANLLNICNNAPSRDHISMGIYEKILPKIPKETRKLCEKRDFELFEKDKLFEIHHALTNVYLEVKLLGHDDISRLWETGLSDDAYYEELLRDLEQNNKCDIEDTIECKIFAEKFRYKLRNRIVTVTINQLKKII